MRIDHQYIADRMHLMRRAEANVRHKLGESSDEYSQAILDEIDRLYDAIYRPHEAAARARVKAAIRDAARLKLFRTPIKLPRRTLN